MNFDLKQFAEGVVSNVVSSIIYEEFLNGIELEERAAILEVYQGALQATIEEMFSDSDVELLEHIMGILKEFILDKSIIKELFWVALKAQRPNEYILRQWLDNHRDYTSENLGIDPELFVKTLAKNLVFEFAESASEHGNALHNRKVIQLLNDLQQRLDNPDIFALSHKTSKGLISHGLKKPISRENVEESLTQFCLKGNGVVIGKPGIGKSYLLHQISKKLIDGEYPCICLSALDVCSMSELKAHLNLQIDFVTYLNSVVPDLRHDKGIILIDGYDAIRSSENRDRFINIIRDIIYQTKPHWHIIVSVRTYDAQQSRTLQGLFPSEKILNDIVRCRHFEIPLLSSEEVENAIANIKGLESIYSKNSATFRDLLCIPFNLWLLEQASSDNSYRDLHPINSSVELLTWYWGWRVEEYRLDSLLQSLARKMFDDSSLTASHEQFSQHNDALNELLSLDIIKYTSPKRQSIEFSHNILFDYAVALTMPDDSPQSFVSLFEEHSIKAIIFLPSIEFYFSYLWIKNRTKFWKMFWGIFTLPAPLPLKLSYWIKPIEIIALQADNLGDIDPLYRELKNSNPNAPKVIQFLFQLLLEQNLHDKLMWIDFIELIVEALETGFIFELINTLNKFIDVTKNTDFFVKCGDISRRLAEWVLKNREDINLKNWLDRLGANFVFPMVGKTITTDISASQALIMRVVKLVQEKLAPLQYLTRLVDVFEDIIGSAPEIIVQIYLLAFPSTHLGDGLPFRGGNVLLQLVMSPEQEKNYLEEKLAPYLFSLTKRYPNLGIAVGLVCLNSYITREQVYKKHDQIMDENKAIIHFRDRELTVIYDGSYFWAERENTYEDSWYIMDNAIFSYIDHLIAHEELDNKILDYILDLFRDKAQVCYLWMRLIQTGSKYPQIFAKPLFELILNQRILYGFDLLYRVGHFLTVATPYYTKRQMRQLEKAILNNHITNRDDTKKRLIASIPSEKLVTPKAKLLKAEIEKTGKVYTEPLISFSMFSQPYDEDKDLEERGINLQSSGNDIIRALSKQLKDFRASLQDKHPNLETVGDILSIIKQLHLALQQTELIADKQVQDLAWTYLGEIVAELCNSLKHEEAISSQFMEFYTMFKTIMLDCARYDYPQPDRDIPYNHPGWTPTPTTSAVIGLLTLAYYKVDEDVLETIEQLRDSKSPEVRFLVAYRLGLACRFSPEFYWNNAEKILINEGNHIVLQGLYSNLIWGQIIQDNRAQNYIYKALQQLIYAEFDEELARILMSVIPYQMFVIQSSWAIDIVSQITQNPVGLSNYLSLLVWNILRFVNPSNEDTQALSRAIVWVEETIEIIKTSLFELSNKAISHGWNDEIIDSFNKLQHLLDDIVHHLYFRLGLETNSDTEKNISLHQDNQKTFYFQIKNILTLLSNFPNNHQVVIMSANTVDYFMKIMVGMVRYDPSSIIRMASKIIKHNQLSNYQFDEYGINKFIKLIEQVIVDYPEILKNQEDMMYMWETIEIFINAGRKEAFKLMQRLSDAFR